jgi:hypothetical protein
MRGSAALDQATRKAAHDERLPPFEQPNRTRVPSTTAAAVTSQRTVECSGVGVSAESEPGTRRSTDLAARRSVLGSGDPLRCCDNQLARSLVSPRVVACNRLTHDRAVPLLGRHDVVGLQIEVAQRCPVGRVDIQPVLAVSLPGLDRHLPSRRGRRPGLSWRARCAPARSGWRRRLWAGDLAGGSQFAIERYGHAFDLARRQRRCAHRQDRQPSRGDQLHTAGASWCEQQRPLNAHEAQCRPDRHGGQAGFGEDLGDHDGLALGLLEQLRPVPAIDPQLATSTASLQLARVVLRVDGLNPGRRYQDVVDVRPRAGDASIVQSTRRRQLVERSCHDPLALGSLAPCHLTLGREQQVGDRQQTEKSADPPHTHKNLHRDGRAHNRHRRESDEKHPVTAYASAPPRPDSFVLRVRRLPSQARAPGPG